MSYTTFRNKLISVLGTLAGVGKPFQEFHPVLKAKPGGFPVLMLNPIEGSTEIRLNTNSNFVTMKYQVIALWNVEDTDDLGVKIAAAMDSVADAFRTSAYVDTLDGVVDKFDVSAPEPIQTEGDNPLVGFRVVFSGGERRTF